MFEHLDIDVEHARRFFEILHDFDIGEVNAGAMWSLNQRAKAWDNILNQIEQEAMCLDALSTTGDSDPATTARPSTQPHQSS
jgi:hypothetical protein